mgnify:CR=1 FL=1
MLVRDVAGHVSVMLRRRPRKELASSRLRRRCHRRGLRSDGGEIAPGMLSWSCRSAPLALKMVVMPTFMCTNAALWITHPAFYRSLKYHNHAARSHNILRDLPSQLLVATGFLELQRALI